MNENHIRCDIKSQYFIDTLSRLDVDKEIKWQILMALKSINDSKLSYRQFVNRYKPSPVSVHKEVEEVNVLYCRIELKIQECDSVIAFLSVKKCNEFTVFRFSTN